GKTFRVLIEGDSKKSDKDWKGRNSQNKMIIFSKEGQHKPGDYVWVKVVDSTSATLKGEMVEGPGAQVAIGTTFSDTEILEERLV
ncbi:MAG: TRAM domain-containing protein, partial [Bacteroidota bacterium]